MAALWRLLLCAVGTVLTTIAIIFYEDEEKKIQTALEELWLSMSYAAQNALVHEPGFLNMTVRSASQAPRTCIWTTTSIHPVRFRFNHDFGGYVSHHCCPKQS
jgi:hypothetical protein